MGEKMVLRASVRAGLSGLALGVIVAACDPAPDTTVRDADEPAYDAGGVETPTRSEVDEIGATEPGSQAQAAQASRASAQADMEARSGSDVAGTLTVTEEDGFLRVRGEITGLTPGVHGLHIHETGDCSAPDGSSAGGHFAPTSSIHGAPTQSSGLHHAGDLGNIVADESGVASIDVIDDLLKLSGAEGVMGRAIVVHADADDLTSQPSGNSGARVGCGVIERTTAGGPAAG